VALDDGEVKYLLIVCRRQRAKKLRVAITGLSRSRYLPDGCPLEMSLSLGEPFDNIIQSRITDCIGFHVHVQKLHASMPGDLTTAGTTG
jgi:hypothetical protein